MHVKGGPDCVLIQGVSSPRFVSSAADRVPLMQEEIKIISDWYLFGFLVLFEDGGHGSVDDGNLAVELRGVGDELVGVRP